jgi:hypothetical protein
MSLEIPLSTLRVNPEKESPKSPPTDHPSHTLEYGGDTADGPFLSPRIAAYVKRFENQLVEYNLEARGIERVQQHERMKNLSWVSYLQAFLLWVSINLAANNITLGMLGPVVYGLSFLDSALCAVLGALVGALVASWMATWGPISGIRTMVGFPQLKLITLLHTNQN